MDDNGTRYGAPASVLLMNCPALCLWNCRCLDSPCRVSSFSKNTSVITRNPAEAPQTHGVEDTQLNLWVAKFLH